MVVIISLPFSGIFQRIYGRLWRIADNVLSPAKKGAKING